MTQPVEPDEIGRLVAAHRLDRVPPRADLAREHLRAAERHIALAAGGVDADPVGAFQLAYDAYRKVLVGLLISRGVRPTTRGGHVVVQDAVIAMFGDDLAQVSNQFPWIRRIRNQSEYPTGEHPAASPTEAVRAIGIAREILEAATPLVPG